MGNPQEIISFWNTSPSNNYTTFKESETSKFLQLIRGGACIFVAVTVEVVPIKYKEQREKGKEKGHLLWLNRTMTDFFMFIDQIAREADLIKQ